MNNANTQSLSDASKVIAIVGVSGGGLNTALNVLEDCGYHRIDNIPPKMLSGLFSEMNDDRAIALGFGGLGENDYADLTRVLKAQRDERKLQLVFIDADDDVLFRRYSETRRRHPHSGASALRDGIYSERAVLIELRKLADHVVDTSTLTPHQLKVQIKQIFGLEQEHKFHIDVQSFSYKHGVPRDADMVFDCRFLRNPHWDAKLRPMDGRDELVAQYVAHDINFKRYLADIDSMLSYSLPAVRAEGRSYFSLCFGCSGGRHRSVAIAELIQLRLLDAGWQTTIRHRELDPTPNLKVTS